MTPSKSKYDAVVVGAGPNGLAAAIALAQKGLAVLLTERADSVGGGARTEELTLPGFYHDVCSAVHPMAVASPFLRSLPLHQYGLEWIYPEVQVAHPFDDGSVALLHRSIPMTAEAMGVDRPNYEKLFAPLVRDFAALAQDILAPIVHFPRHPLVLSRYGLKALWPADRLARHWFAEEKTQALFLGIAAHVGAPLNRLASSAIGVALQAAAHAVGWPMPKGGAGNLSNALALYFRALGGEIRTGFELKAMDQLPPSRAVLFDLTPRQILAIAAEEIPASIRRQFAKYQYGPSVFKMDWALNRPIPWKNRDCLRAATLHLGGGPDEILRSEQGLCLGRHSSKPFVLLTQPTLFDSTRAPTSMHIAWAYCHVPHGFTEDVSATIENQIERFAPGFNKTVVHKNCLFPQDLEKRNPNLVGGEISGGLVSGRQLFWRPRVGMNPYRLGRNLWICSSSTPPGPAVHGMCGYWAAQAALREL